MQNKTYNNVTDKSSWQRGPWDNEPDKMQWKDEATGLPCLIVRGPIGALCGYVGVDESHPYYRKDYEHPDINHPHGGLTYANHCSTDVDESHSICHVPDPGESDHVWWFGFDCAHYNDLMPGATYRSSLLTGVYRTIEYVRNECTELAKELHAKKGDAS